MSRDSEWSGSYPEAEPWPEYEAVQANPYDSPDLLIAQGQSRYTTKMFHALEHETGDRETFLTATQEYELAQIIQRGVRAESLIANERHMSDDDRLMLDGEIIKAREARDRLVLANLRLAAYYARASMNILTPQDRNSKERIGTFTDITRLRSSSASLEDRIQLANEGLIHAAEKFKPHLSEKTGKPTRFSTFAFWHIQQVITRGVEMTEHTGVRLTTNALAELSQAAKDPSSLTPKRRALLAAQRQQSIVHTSFETVRSGVIDDESDNDNWDEPLELSLAELATSDQYADDDKILANRFLNYEVEKLLDSLSERESGVIRMRFGIGYPREYTFDEVGEVFGVTRERIRQIESKTMAKLRHPSRSDGLEEFNDDRSTTPNNITVPAMTDGVLNVHLPAYDEPAEELSLASDEPRAERSSSLESWQVNADESWDEPVFRQPEALMEDHQVMAVLRDTIGSRFTQEFSKRIGEPGVPVFPAELLEELKDALGRSIDWRHIESWWNEELPALLEANKQAMIDSTQVGLFVTMLLHGTSRTEDEVRLTMPESLGKPNYFGYGLRFGRVIVDGDLGDHAGANMGGVGVLEVNGSVGDDAGRGMKDYATLLVHGDAGYRFGEASDSVFSVCEGSVKKVELASVAEAPRPVAVRRNVAKAAFTIGSLQSKIRAQETMLESLYTLGDDASSFQINRLSERIVSLKQTLQGERNRQYWQSLRSASRQKDDA